LTKKSRDVLRYSPKAVSRGTVKRQYLSLRSRSGDPVRCDNEACTFHTVELQWNDAQLPVILDHVNGNSHDNRPVNLRLLCPNCDAQLITRGGKNRGRVRNASGGFGVRSAKDTFDYILFAEPMDLKVSLGNVRAEVLQHAAGPPESRTEQQAVARGDA